MSLSEKGRQVAKLARAQRKAELDARVAKDMASEVMREIPGPEKGLINLVETEEEEIKCYYIVVGTNQRRRVEIGHGVGVRKPCTGSMYVEVDTLCIPVGSEFAEGPCFSIKKNDLVAQEGSTYLARYLSPHPMEWFMDLRHIGAPGPALEDIPTAQLWGPAGEERSRLVGVASFKKEDDEIAKVHSLAEHVLKGNGNMHNRWKVTADRVEPYGLHSLRLCINQLNQAKVRPNGTYKQWPAL